MFRAHSDVLVLVHVVFAVRDRRQLLRRDRDRALHEYVRGLALDKRAEVLAIGNAADHVHVVLSLHAAVPLAEVVRTIKGGSSYALNREVGLAAFAWQSGYWARSLSSDSLPNVCEYVSDQRGRHARGALDRSSNRTRQQPSKAGATSSQSQEEVKPEGLERLSVPRALARGNQLWRDLRKPRHRAPRQERAHSVAHRGANPRGDRFVE